MYASTAIYELLLVQCEVKLKARGMKHATLVLIKERVLYSSLLFFNSLYICNHSDTGRGKKFLADSKCALVVVFCTARCCLCILFTLR